MRKIKGLILLILLTAMCPCPGFAQTNPAENKTLYEALLYLGNKCNLKLAFDADMAKMIKIKVDFEKLECDHALSELLTGSSFWFVKMNNVYIIKPIKKVPEEQQKKINPSAAIAHRPTLWITGLVRQQNTCESLPFSNIQIEGTHAGTIANGDGYFTLSVNPLDTINLIISHIGFITQRYNLNPSLKTKLHLVELKPYSFEVGPVVVKGTDDIEMVQVGNNRRNLALNVTQVTGMPSLHPLDVILPLKLLPGIDGTTESSSGLRIRKSSPDKTLILYDGYPIYSIDHLYGMLSSFNQKTIKDIQVHKGINHARFDGAPGGVIEITGKSGNKKNLNIDTGIDLLNANVVAEAPLGRNISVIASFRRSYSDLMKTEFYRKQFKNIRYDIENNSHMPPSFLGADPEIPEQVFSDYTAKITVNPSLGNLFSLSVFGGNDEISFQNIKTGGEVSETSRKLNSGGSLRWAKQWNPTWYSSFLAGYSSHYSSFNHHEKFIYNRPQIVTNSNVVGLEQEQVNEISDFSFEINNSLKFSDNYKFDFGIKSNKVSTSFTDIYNQAVGQKSLIRSDKKIANEGTITSIYLQNNFLFNRFRYLDIGLRSSYFSITRQVFVEPRISMNYEVARNLSFKASYGKYSQFNNRIVIPDQADYQYLWSLSDENHPVVTSNQVCAGLLVAPGHGLTLDIEMYRKKTSNLMAVQNILLISKQTADNQARKYFQYDNLTNGIDFFLKKYFGPLQVWISYTLSESTDRSDLLENTPEFPALDHQPHELKLFGIFHHKGWCVSSSWIYGSGKRWDRPVSLSEMETTYKKNSVVLPPYHRMDIGLEKNSMVGKLKVNTALKIFNVYNHENVLTRQYFVNDFPSASVTKNNYLQINEVTGSGFIYNIIFNFRF